MCDYGKGIDINTAKWLSLEHACIYMTGLSENTVLKHIREGDIYGIRKGGKWVIDRESIDEYYNTERAAERILFERIKAKRGRRRKVDSTKLRML
ncbi:MAG: helix-turn-helix domain-containing protein [Nitrospirae bacterium]|nr:helix-turn-helix domain-containing protein [Nitrospirota bacterium]